MDFTQGGDSWKLRTLFFNGIQVLTVKDLKLGESAHGAIGLFVDIGTEGFFRNMRIDNES